MKRFCVTVLLFLFCNAAQAQVGGPGAMSCEYFLEHKRKNLKSDDIVTWAQGMISGLNIAAEMHDDRPILFPDEDTIYSYIDTSCSENPLAQIGLVVARMYGELKARSR